MPTKEQVTKVWIEPGCIVCDACETTCPEVFNVTEDTCLIRPEAMSPDFTKPLSESIIDAAEECPVDVIKFESQEVEVSEEEAAPAEKSDAGEEKAAPAEKKPAETKPAEKKPAEKKPAAKKEAPAKEAEPVAAGAAEEDDGSDPGIAALLRAAAYRGGMAGILKKREALPDSADRLARQDPKNLPPDARQARVIAAARDASKDPDKGRRAVVGSAALTLGWIAFGTGVGISVGPAFGRFMMPNVLEEPDPRVRVGPLKKYTEMETGAVNEDFKPQGIWMIRLEDRIAALNIICTHLGCIPNWLPNDRKFKCPCHGSGYYQNAINFEGPTPRPLERFRILVDGGQVIVDKSKKYQYELGQWDMQGSYLEV